MFRINILIFALFCERISSGQAFTSCHKYLSNRASSYEDSYSTLLGSTANEESLSNAKAAASRSSISSYETFGDGTLSDETFAELYSSASKLDEKEQRIPSWLTERCSECGWTNPTLVQQRSIDVILKGSDVVIQAQTGSGKTLSYLLPLLARIDASRAAIQALVVVPTRELGLQVARVAKRLAAGSGTDTAAGGKIMIMSILQGSNHKRQRAWAWAEPPHVVIGTPEELTNMVRFGGIKYNAVNYVVVDEVDACLLNNAGSMSSNLASSGPLHELLSRHLSPTFEVADRSADESGLNLLLDGGPSVRPIIHRQSVFCSATIPQHRYFLKQCVQNQWTLREPMHVCASPGELIPPTLQHTSVICTSQEKKFAALRRTIKKMTGVTKVLIFAESQRPMEEMGAVLAKDLDGIYWKEGYGPEQEHGAKCIVSVLRYEDNLAARASAMLGFMGIDGGSIGGRKFGAKSTEDTTNGSDESDRDDKLRILFSTDLAARGLDVTDISHVINFDLPPDADTYVHRGGRAGRLGRRGMVVSLITNDQEFVLERLANKLSLDVRCIARQQQKKKRNSQN
mmetsp:Transcript_23697/g.36599  ORF Transcript_23697/g.36599 Transcript_23697/m.36599 type:complete len:570 (-) Transcript_23697:64-1773(-)|eukprot:CAMPEP_0195283298 /NCGR_PEP_ID=MMETSP0707-20130614/1887_1 /TAXON_ID=33640 /ORGANISM="Asterionellopsis glacialis, Strain CCMP134" /LENGTH=569 /DNA_ID=CAMNT_0040342439 /DNA_START=99 /DNA_END=1808 /DNA_ORIENTATION=+